MSPSRRWWVRLAAVLTVGLLIRLPFLAQLGPTSDVTIFLRWSRVLDEQGFTNLYTATNMNYGPVQAYLFGITAVLHQVLGLDHGGWVVLVRLPAVLADVATAALLAVVTLRRTNSQLLALVVCSAYLFNPVVWYVSAYWGQVDSLYALLLVLSVLALERGAVPAAWGLYAGVLGLKLTGISFAPLLIAWTAARHGLRGIVTGAGVFAAVAVALLAPWLLTGHAGAVLHHAYLDIPTETPRVDVSAYNGWYLALRGHVHDTSSHAHPFGLPVDYQLIGAVAFAAAAVVIVARTLRSGSSPSLPAATLALCLFLLATQQHERYAFPAIALLLLAAIGTSGLSPEVSRIYAVLSLALLFNLTTVASFAPGLFTNLVVVGPYVSHRIAFLKGAAFGAAAVACVVFGRLISLVGCPRPPAVPDGGDG